MRPNTRASGVFASSLLYIEDTLLCFQFIFKREGGGGGGEEGGVASSSRGVRPNTRVSGAFCFIFASS